MIDQVFDPTFTYDNIAAVYVRTLRDRTLLLDYPNNILLTIKTGCYTCQVSSLNDPLDKHIKSNRSLMRTSLSDENFYPALVNVKLNVLYRSDCLFSVLLASN